LPSDGVLSGKGYISGKGLVEKEAMEMTHSKEEADLYDPDWEVHLKVELEVDIKESDEGPSWTNTVALSPVQK
jgi:hypothetical protein